MKITGGGKAHQAQDEVAGNEERRGNSIETKLYRHSGRPISSQRTVRLRDLRGHDNHSRCSGHIVRRCWLATALGRCLTLSGSATLAVALRYPDYEAVEMTKPKHYANLKKRIVKDQGHNAEQKLEDADFSGCARQQTKHLANSMYSGLCGRNAPSPTENRH